MLIRKQKGQFMIISIFLFSHLISRRSLRKEVERQHEEAFMTQWNLQNRLQQANQPQQNNLISKKSTAKTEQEKSAAKKAQFADPYLNYDPFSNKTARSGTIDPPTNTNNTNTNNQNRNNTNRTAPQPRQVVDIPPSPQPEWGKKYA